MITFNNPTELQIALEIGTIQNPQFVSLRSYENQEGEISNYLLNMGTSYHNAQMADLMMLQFCTVADWNFPNHIPGNVCQQAFNELYDASNRNVSDNIEEHTMMSKVQLEMYDPIMPNVKVHIHNSTLYVTGMLIRKTVVQPIVYRTRNKRILTEAKDVIRRDFATGKYRQFFLDKIRNIKVNGRELILEL